MTDTLQPRGEIFEEFTADKAKEMKTTWINTLKNSENDNINAVAMTAVAIERFVTIVEWMMEDEKVQKGLPKRKGGGVLERQKLDEVDEFLKLVHHFLIEKGGVSEEKMDKTRRAWEITLDRIISYEYNVGMKYTEILEEWGQYLHMIMGTISAEVVTDVESTQEKWYKILYNMLYALSPKFGISFIKRTEERWEKCEAGSLQERVCEKLIADTSSILRDLKQQRDELVAAQ